MARFGVLIIIYSAGVFFGGCASKPRQPVSILDSPEHHVYSGFKLIKMERFDDALREFKEASEHDPKNHLVQMGLGLVYGMKKQFRPAFESMALARDYAENKEDKAMAYVGFMRLNSMKKEKGWLEEIEKNFFSATSIMKDLPEAYFYLAMAYKDGFRFADAVKALKKVLDIDKGFIVEAKGQLKILKKIEKTLPKSELGRRVAVQDHVTRAEMAALLIQELKLDRIFKKGFKKQPIPTDVESHALKAYLEVILKLDIQGLRPFPDGTFGPDEYLYRANYAMIIADIIAKIENDSSLNSRYTGDTSPFRDVHTDAHYFNAIMVCTTRGRVMEAKNGIFNPMGKVSGADALLTLKKLSEELKIVTDAR